MAFVHGHAREAGWVVSHYRRPQLSGQGQLDLGPEDLPAPRDPADDENDVENDVEDAADGDAGPQSRT